MNQAKFISLLYEVCSYEMVEFVLYTVLITSKLFLLYIINQQRRKVTNTTPLLLLSIPIFCYIIGESALVFFQCTFDFTSRIVGRLAWNLQPLQFYTEVLFLYSISQQNYTLKELNKYILYALLLFGFMPFLSIFIATNQHISLFQLLFDIFCRSLAMKRFILKMGGQIFLLVHVYIVWKKIKISSLPCILRAQLKIFLLLICFPIIPDTILAFVDVFDLCLIFHMYRLLDLLSMVFFTFALLFFTRKIYGLRFLNMTDRVLTGPISRLTDEHMVAIKQALYKARDTAQLAEIHATFFHQLCDISSKRIIFYIRNPELCTSTDAMSSCIEHFVQEHPQIAARYFVEDSLLVYEELAFTNFYEPSPEYTKVLEFLEQLDAAVLIPLKHNDRFFGAIIIKRNTQQQELISQSVQLHMQLYGVFVTYALSRFEHISYCALSEKYNALSLELFQVNQKNARFYETMISLLKLNTVKRSGMLLYKNSLFSYINPMAEELLGINPNKYPGHPLSKALKELVRRVYAYEASQCITEKNGAGIELYFQAFFSKSAEVFISVCEADVRNTLPIEQSLLQPDDIPYAFFLYGTDAGTAVREAFPGGGDLMHQAKVRMLKILLSKKIMLLDVHEDDIDLVLDVAKKVCHKTVVQHVDAATMPSAAIASALFGRQVFANSDMHIEHGLLYALDEFGIIHVKNAHCLDLKTQELLVYFLKVGSFYLYRTEIRCTSNATIILSSQEDLSVRIKQGFFLQPLYDYLVDSIIALPNPLTMPFAELEECASAIQRQLITVPEYYHLFGFSGAERDQLNVNRPESYASLRRRVNYMIKQRSIKSSLGQETIECISNITQQNELLLEAARRGKQALKDRQLMKALWEKLKSQVRIAEILDVDRSSVHRRLKEYGIVSSGTE